MSILNWNFKIFQTGGKRFLELRGTLEHVCFLPIKFDLVSRMSFLPSSYWVDLHGELIYYGNNT